MRAGLCVLGAALALPALAWAADFRSTGAPATILYDAPSARAKPLFVYGRGVPVESLVTVEGWTKVRDASGTIGWMPTPALSDSRTLVVRAPAFTLAKGFVPRSEEHTSELQSPS